MATPLPSLTQVDATAGWFGPVDRPLFGWVHRPARAGTAVRGLVVMCPSLGQEVVTTRFTLRAAADDLAASGFVVVRPDYDGTGDSAGGDADPDRLAAWLDSVEHAITLGRSITRAPLVLVGLRVGGLLAVAAADRLGERPDPDRNVHGLVLWDTPRSGRHYLRELVVRQNVSVGGAEAGDGVSAFGVILSQRACDELSTLTLRRPTLPADAVLVLEATDRTSVPADVTTRTGQSLTRLPAPDQDELVTRHLAPRHTLRNLVRWCEQSFAMADHRAAAATQLRPTAEFDGIRERVESIGPHGLFGVSTEPARPASSRTTVVIACEWINPHIGLTRQWTRLAREWARAGVRSVRFDLGGCGDSPVRDGVAPQQVSLFSHIADTVAAARHVNPDDPAASVFVGLSSGGYLAVEAALDVGARGVTIINPELSFITPEPRPDPRRRAIVLTRPTLRRLLGPLVGRLARRLVGDASGGAPGPAFARRPEFDWSRALDGSLWRISLLRAAPWLPDRAWRVLNLLLTATPGLDRTVRTLRAGGSEVQVIVGGQDHARVTAGARRRLGEMIRRGELRVDHLPTVDHAMIRPGADLEVGHCLSDFVLGIAAGVEP